ncbi:hypothetical protein NY2A_b036R [Paramecium bursaria Chlorella virus NY2A]|uniref:Uncharacterized protein b036R n=1 Tax=Paramecium bursaria Chlorella virus NY2A TaxID=46021 RepID=A7IVR1_PBCVN|nr:hypothetical protein NY2A_b036R [Paramecium bursaria Chlorella virus NY2A]YP_001498115.1 hypothetical protein AR158_C033R [Paramecium bursaria Chlorella virus AR158]ABT14435.1 hypothetical protein NY2A_b036R [Paramecium bursaria Chlorella virus NY2A]ABU43579.1 hypothetical protein AR158_C033R [Paramecium bursaria Chlorella virus AR158]
MLVGAVHAGIFVIRDPSPMKNAAVVFPVTLSSLRTAFPLTITEFVLTFEASTFPLENTLPEIFTFCVPDIFTLVNKDPFPMNVFATTFPVTFT